MLRKYTKYAATAFAVASLSTFMIGCGEVAEEDTTPEVPPTEPETSEAPAPGADAGADAGAGAGGPGAGEEPLKVPGE